MFSAVTIVKGGAFYEKIKLFAILTVMLTMLISVNAFAAVYDGEPGLIEITGGIDMESEYESTFDDTVPLREEPKGAR